jgi:hypothetical protein
MAALLVAEYIYFAAKSKQLIAQCNQTDPTIACYPGKYIPGKFMSMRACRLKIVGGKLQLTSRSGKEIFSTDLAEVTIRQGGPMQWFRIELQSASGTWWISAFSYLNIYLFQRGIFLVINSVLPARNALFKLLADHGAIVSPDSVS